MRRTTRIGNGDAIVTSTAELLERRTLMSAGGIAADLAHGNFASDEILVRFKKNADATGEGKVVHGATVGKHVGADAKLHKVKLTGGQSVADALAAYANDPRVDFAEPNWIVTTEATSNDPYYTNGSLWGMYGDGTTPANQYGSQAGEAWAAGKTGSKSVYVAVIDEGIQYTHPDIDSNIWTNPFDPVDGRDNDNNGYIDDTHGWDFYNNNNSIYDGTTGKGKKRTTSTTIDAHGTHVTGTIAGEGGNGTGVAGVNWNVNVISAKFLGPSGGFISDAIEAVDYVTNLKKNHGLNIVATNNSWGGGGFSQAFLDAITRAAQQNILFIAAAGNSAINSDSSPQYPASYSTAAGAGYDAVISVAAIDKNGALASFSNYGATKVDLGAPGVAVYSSVPNNTYASYSGTSMATPHVTGAAALYAAAYPGATALQIKNAILSSATPTASLSGKTVTGGRLNIGNLINVTPSGATSLAASESLVPTGALVTAATFKRDALDASGLVDDALSA